MATKTLIATFDSITSANGATHRLAQIGVGSNDFQVKDHQLHAVVDDAYYKLAIDALRGAGALDIETKQNRADSEDWMSHHYGRVTSVGVPPGQGDSEAGKPD